MTTRSVSNFKCNVISRQTHMIISQTKTDTNSFFNQTFYLSFYFCFIKLFYKMVNVPLSFQLNLYKIRSAVTEEREGSRQRFSGDDILSHKYCVRENYKFLQQKRQECQHQMW